MHSSIRPNISQNAGILIRQTWVVSRRRLLLQLGSSKEWIPFFPQSWKWKMGPSKSSDISNAAIFHFHDSEEKSNIKGLEAIKIHLANFTTMLKTSRKKWLRSNMATWEGGYPFVQFQGGEEQKMLKWSTDTLEKSTKLAKSSKTPSVRSCPIKTSPKTQALKKRHKSISCLCLCERKSI